MLKYAKIINEETKQCEVGLGTNAEFYKSIGMTQQDVEQSDVDNCWYLKEYCPHKSEEEKEREERERINQLSLTKREVFLAIYRDKQITPEQIRSMLTTDEARIEFDYANDYFRGNPLIGQLGEALEYTSEQLDTLFETGEL
ncbi:MAG: hypothetical protein MJ230_04475 [bacterium]|nr:hypothetical protein [bacterium]